MPAMWAASAFLSELLNAVESVITRSMFLVGVSIASSSLFVAVMASPEQPWEPAIVPVVLTLGTAGSGLWTLWLNRLPQFPDPGLLKRGSGLGISDDQIAWEIVEAVASAGEVVQTELNRISRISRRLLVMTALQLASECVIGLWLIA
jgi:hypothetical protein